MDKTIYITGGSKGLGLQICKLLQSRYQIVNFSRSSADVPNAINIHLDFSRPNTIHIPDELPEPNVLVINVGIMYGLSIEDYSLEQAVNIVNINLTSNLVLLGKSLKRSKKLKKIILISSTAASNGHPDIFYSATKSAFRGVYESLRHLYGHLGINVYLLELGRVANTEFSSKLSSKSLEYLKNKTVKSGKKLEPDNIANIVNDLLSNKNISNSIIKLGDTSSWCA